MNEFFIITATNKNNKKIYLNFSEPDGYPYWSHKIAFLMIKKRLMDELNGPFNLIESFKNKSGDYYEPTIKADSLQIVSLSESNSEQIKIL